MNISELLTLEENIALVKEYIVNKGITDKTSYRHNRDTTKYDALNQIMHRIEDSPEDKEQFLSIICAKNEEDSFFHRYLLNNAMQDLNDDKNIRNNKTLEEKIEYILKLRFDNDFVKATKNSVMDLAIKLRQHRQDIMLDTLLDEKEDPEIRSMAAAGLIVSKDGKDKIRNSLFISTGVSTIEKCCSNKPLVKINIPLLTLLTKNEVFTIGALEGILETRPQPKSIFRLGL